jgi:hypothetical protein
MPTLHGRNYIREAKVWAYRKSASEDGRAPEKDDRAVVQGRKKKRCALWVGFVGEKYVGSQINRCDEEP